MAIPEGMTIDNFLRLISDQVRDTAKRVEFYTGDYGRFSPQAQVELKVIVNNFIRTHQSDLQSIIDFIASLP